MNKNLFKAIVTAGLIVGTFDIISATTQTLLYGRDPLNMYKYIASGVFGSYALSGGMNYAILGLFFHYCIAMIWTVIFFLIYPKVTLLARSKILTGIVYGFVVWLLMSQVVLPLSNTPSFPFSLKGAVIGMLILMVAIGIPLSFMANRYYRNVEK